MSAYWQSMVRDAFDCRDQYRPQSRDEMRLAALELRQRGLLPADIAAALRISEGAVSQLLGDAPQDATYPPNTNGIST
ncbi:MAG: hypothetical protein ACYDAE_00320 [Steroidobacteraceae bacterium]